MYNLYEKIQNSRVFIIAGPCVLESEQLAIEVAGKISEICNKIHIPYIFKSSFDKANRTDLKSFRGYGLDAGLKIFEKLKQTFKLPILTDIHESNQAAVVAAVVDIIQIPAFLCRQTDLLIAAGNTNKIVHIKKAQFLTGAEMQMPSQKVAATGNHRILLCERGNMYGYNNLVVDFTNIVDMKKIGYPVVMDCTHTVQKPGSMGTYTGGNRNYVPYMAKAAAAVGVDGYFFEVHPNPENAQSDGPNMLKLDEFEHILNDILEYHYITLKQNGRYQK